MSDERDPVYVRVVNTTSLVVAGCAAIWLVLWAMGQFLPSWGGLLAIAFIFLLLFVAVRMI